MIIHSPSQCSAGSKPIIIRLPNWVGDTVQCLATLELLQQAGYRLHLIGKPWVRDLFAAYDWRTYSRPAKSTAAIAQLWRLRRQLKAEDASFARRINMVLLTDSHRSAMEAGLAGLRALGYARNVRSYYLRRRLRRVRDSNALAGYWRLGAALLDNAAPSPQHINLALSRPQVDAARALLRSSQIRAGYAVLCPFSGKGQESGRKRWPAFPELAHTLNEQGIPVVLCPGPGEEDEARRDYPAANTLTSVPLGVYAALMRGAWCTIANDTGPGHIAAAAGANLVSVVGPHYSPRWAPLGPRVAIAGHAARWPGLEEVMARLPAQPLE
jgi:heptosyltransferase-2